MDTSKHLAWFVAGASVGAALALLFAPQSGEETRQYLGSKARKGRRKLVDVGRDALDRSRDLFDRGRELADEAADMVEEGVESARRSFQG
ncbi:MAG: YtxH domain-containing protein [Acidobacteriota bacterium]